MRRLIALSLLLGAETLSAQGFFDSSIRTGPQFYSYTIHGAEKVSELAFPVFVVVPVTTHFTMDLGTAYASADLDRTNSNQTHSKSTVSGLTDTQLRGNYSFSGDLFV